MKCKICTAPSNHFSTARIFTYNVAYFQCGQCGFIQTEEPFWLEDAYAETITASDIGLMDRNIIDSKITHAIIQMFFNSKAKFMDYGGGYGVLVRLMRDTGFDFYRYDKFCDNLFAKGFDANLADETHYELITAFELFEHLVEPLVEIEQLLKFSGNILFSTLLVPINTPQPEEWWYYGLDHGQHVSLYSLESLRYIAKKFNLNLYTNKRSLHLLTEKRISQPVFSLITRYRVATLVNLIFRRKSLLADDYLKLTGKSTY